jgi:hypothetical protein
MKSGGCLLLHCITASLRVQLLLVVLALLGAVGGVLPGQRCRRESRRWVVKALILCSHSSIAICRQERAGRGTGTLYQSGVQAVQGQGLPACLQCLPVYAGCTLRAGQGRAALPGHAPAQC